VIVIDTSVWIDVFNNRATPQSSHAVDLIADGQPVALTDVVFTEILQGFRSEQEAERVEEHLRAFPILRPETLDDHAYAAQLYRDARRAGVTIRKTLDCLIAAACIRADAPILHADRDFDLLASCTPLRVHEAPRPTRP
jgi:predicted nucleic acid-binding protein